MKWIKTAGTLPKENEMVVAHYDDIGDNIGGRINLMYYDEGDWYLWYGNGHEPPCKSPDYWIEIPEAPTA